MNLHPEIVLQSEVDKAMNEVCHLLVGKRCFNIKLAVLCQNDETNHRLCI